MRRRNTRPTFALIVSLGLACSGRNATPEASTPLAKPSTALRFPKATVRVEDVALGAKFEADLAKTYDVPPPANGSWFTIIPGPSRVLVTAPHATAQMREGTVKAADGGTGSLAVLLNRLANATAVHTTYASPSDPNFYDDNDFKRAVKKLVDERKPRLVLDLHASHPSHPYDVDFGTMNGASLLGHPDLLDGLATHLRAEGLANFSQDRFPASKNQTVTKWVTSMGTPTIQLEINATWLLPPLPPVASSAESSAAAFGLQQQRFAQLLQGLVRFIADIDAQP